MRSCLRDPIPELLDVARYLDAAATADLDGDTVLAAHLLKRADSAAVRSWLDSVWGRNSPYVRARWLPKPALGGAVVQERMPTGEQMRLLHERDGFHCRYCGIPVIRADVRRLASKKYPDTVTWGRTNASQHAGFQALWAQYDHVRPHAWGGTNELENLVVACAACNYGKMSYSLEELDLDDPRGKAPSLSTWDGLERWLPASISLRLPAPARSLPT